MSVSIHPLVTALSLAVCFIIVIHFSVMAGLNDCNKDKFIIFVVVGVYHNLKPIKQHCSLFLS